MLCTGEIDEEDAFDWSNASDLMSYWRELFPAVSTEDVEKFHNEYKGINMFTSFTCLKLCVCKSVSGKIKTINSEKNDYQLRDATGDNLVFS